MSNIEFKQLIVYVNNMEKMVAFYKDILGLVIAYPHVENYINETWVAFSTGPVTFALHSGKETSIVPVDAPKYNFEVDNIHETRQNLLEKGMKMQEITNATPTKLICSGRDPEGNGFFIESTTD
ncbi:MAG: hypothetical protein GPJ54_18405 [Candidatus Heimdallarchaeota archaeon]|nr:hypothetical protein [Candidatus Heimdallarchaeota archaeon]